MAGLLDPQLPNLKRVDLDPESQAMLNDSVKRASADPSDFAAIANEGVSERAGQLNQSNQAISQEAASRGQDPAMLDALRGVYGQKAQDQIGRIKTQNQMNAPIRKSEALQGISAAAIGAQQAKNSFYQQLTDAYNQSEANRAQLVSTIFQTGTQAYIAKRMAPPGSGANQGLQLGPGEQTPASNFNQNPYTLA